jgi:hypothetical protein
METDLPPILAKYVATALFAAYHASILLVEPTNMTINLKEKLH